MDNIKTLLDQENFQQQSDQKKTQDSCSGSLRQRKIMLALWARMTQLFGHKWESQEGPAQRDGQLSSNLLFWTNKTKDLTDNDFKRAFERLEHDVTASVNEGKEIWPPTYAAFLGYAQELTGNASYRVFERVTAKALPISDQIKKERQEVGIRECANILGMFDDE